MLKKIYLKRFLFLTILEEIGQKLSLECHYRNAMSLPQRTSISYATSIYNNIYIQQAF